MERFLGLKPEAVACHGSATELRGWHRLLANLCAERTIGRGSPGLALDLLWLCYPNGEQSLNRATPTMEALSRAGEPDLSHKGER